MESLKRLKRLFEGKSVKTIKRIFIGCVSFVGFAFAVSVHLYGLNTTVSVLALSICSICVIALLGILIFLLNILSDMLIKYLYDGKTADKGV